MKRRLAGAASGLLLVGGATLAQEGGSFVPSRAGAAQYAPAQAPMDCPRGALPLLIQDAQAAAKQAGRPPPEADGRLCAMADAFLAWNGKDLPPENVVRFLAWHFGLPSPPSGLTMVNIETDDSRIIAERLLDPVAKFAARAARPRVGLAVRRISGAGRNAAERAAAGQTKIVLVMLDAALELQPLARQVPAGGEAPLSGRVAGAKSVSVVTCDPSGKLDTPKAQPGDSFTATLRCGDKPGRLLVDVRAERDGQPASVARFPLACGTELPKSAPVHPPAAQQSAAQAARRMFDAINAERSAAGMSPLAWDDAVAAVAQQASDAYKAGSTTFDVVPGLKSVDIGTLAVLQNPLAAPSAEEAEALVAASPVNRCNLLNREVTHAGVGVAPASDPNGGPLLYITELMVRELPPVDAAALRAKVRAAIDDKRQGAGAPPFKTNPALDEVAQKYAAALAAQKGDVSDAQYREIVAPLYKGFSQVDLVGGAKADPMEFADEPIVKKPFHEVGVGVAQGVNAVLGKNAVYVAIVGGSKGEAAAKKATAEAPAKKAPPKKKGGQ